MRVAIAEDSGIVREALSELLTTVGIEVVAAVEDGDRLLAAVAGDPPDVAIVDMRMPPTRTNEGLLTTRRLKEAHPRIAVLVLSADPEAPYAAELFERAQSGVGYFLKDNVSDKAALRDALERLVSGQPVIDPEIAAGLLAGYHRAGEISSLTKRERDILELMAQGLSNAGIGARLFLSIRTVETYGASIFGKLGLSTGPADNRRVLAVLTWLRSGNSR